MTATPIADSIGHASGAHAAPQPIAHDPQPVPLRQPAPPAQQPAMPPVPSHHAWVPRWFVTVLHAGGAAVSHLRPVVMSPEVDQLIEKALRADGLGVEAAIFHAAMDLIDGAADRKQAAQGSGPQQAFLPAPAEDGM